MSKREQILESLNDPEYRRALASDIETGLAFQIRFLRQKHQWTQEELAQKMGKRQETISQWENPNYEGYTVRTIKALADAFDVVPMIRFGTFSELVDWMVELTPERLAPPNYEEEKALKEQKQAQGPQRPIGTADTGVIAGTSMSAAGLTYKYVESVVLTTAVIGYGGEDQLTVKKPKAGPEQPIDKISALAA